MELVITLEGNSENPRVELGNISLTAKEAYSKGPLYAFYISIPHCILMITNEFLQRENKLFNFKIRARYKLKEDIEYLGNFVIDTINIDIITDYNDEKFLENLINIIKTQCPLYLSFPDKINISCNKF
ncbi:OsmC family peroxiredoxin [Acidianus sulfidivorans JP7]|uniref:Oxidoreductase n=1 Tax=Acidianus sulfidivorans JP7 TaxID=619593 RepID=A0A2U9IKZ3_9CREN|nr:OsmC family peroxiredoxin [Acidianus sulfidivorans]AWR96718.1 OsmC family peroxiredoxin [Acidianus sulfidivorans JP7]